MKLFFFYFTFFFCQMVFSQVNNFALANKEMSDKNYVKAEEYYLLAMAEEPMNYNIMTYYAFCKHKQLKYNEADSLLRISIKNDSSNAMSYWFSGLNYVKLKKDSLAVLSFKKFIKTEKVKGSNTLLAYKNVGAAYQRELKTNGLLKWQVEDMIYHYEQVARLEPSDQDIPNIQNFIEIVKSQMPVVFTGKWKAVF